MKNVICILTHCHLVWLRKIGLLSAAGVIACQGWCNGAIDNENTCRWGAGREVR